MCINQKKSIIYFSPHQNDELLTMNNDICNSLNNNWDVHVILCTNEKLTVVEARRLILHYIKDMGKSSVVCTIAPDNGDRKPPTHKALGYAAKELFDEGKIRLLKLFVDPLNVNYQSSYHSNVPAPKSVPVMVYASRQEKENLKNAGIAYTLWQTEVNSYGIKCHRSTRGFDGLLKNEVSYYYNYACRQGSKKLIVSLTSYPARIHCLAQSLATIYRQTMLPDEVVLWLAESQFPKKLKDLPADLLKLVTEKKLSVQWCEDDLKSHKKYFYAFKKYPDALVITIDDDILYHPRLIENLYASWILHPNAVSVFRAHLILISETGRILPYKEWVKDMDVCVSKPSMQLLATNGAGSLYPTALFTKAYDLLDIDTIKRTCPFADDLWLKAMQLVADIPVVVAERCKRLLEVPDSQIVNLWTDNCKNGGNDKQLMQIIQEIDCRYGKNTFLKKLLQADKNDNLADEETLRKLVKHYQDKTDEMVKEKRIFDWNRNIAESGWPFRVKQIVGWLLGKA